MKKSATLFIVMTLLLSACQEKNPCFIKLPSILSDNMVLQQKTDARIWGKANPMHRITITPEWGNPVPVKAGKDGKWLAVIPTPGAGGPYTIQVKGSDTTIIISNILIGEVWFCSGQSNMEMPLAGWPPVDTIMHSAKTISEASLPGIRLFKVQRKVSGVPLEECTGKWEVCSPETVKPFSATAFFFGRKLNKELNIPIGLIESAWGGTPSEAWTSREVLKNAGEFVEEIDAMIDSESSLAEYQTWLGGNKQIEVKPAGDDQWKNLDFGDSGLASVDFDDSTWPSIILPGKFEGKFGEFDGAVWFRKAIELPGDLKGKNMILALGPIDDMDRTYFNGELVGATEMDGFWQTGRNYEVPGNLIREGKNVISVRVLDTRGGGGIWGEPGSMRFVTKDNKMFNFSIEGDWKYQPVAEFDGNKFYVFDYSKQDFLQQKRPKSIGPYSPSTLYNGMVHPILDYLIKGAIWYQGESNVGRADQYAKIFPLMIQNWRDAWEIKDFPFYFVQIAPWIYAGLDADNSVLLREAQAKSLSVPETGMVVTLDIATVMNIHPPFKLEVGERLANLALANDYGIQVPTLGPVYKSMVLDGATMKISFDNAESGLFSTTEYIPGFEIAGKDGRYVKAIAKIVGSKVWVSSPEILEPEAVRYCWRNGAIGTLFNKDGLPASQFRTKE
ncbi:MAG: sialate O-acetylesterase [Bacteroidales bacterium]|jgi:sialate O-acetylesterase|nr:sialate O-acetylesterase [Bacteroidales bacterium]